MSRRRAIDSRARTALRAFAAAVAAVLLTAAAAACGAASSGLVLEHDGLLADHAFDTPRPTASLMPTFRLGGTAGLANSTVSQTSGGLRVGVGPHAAGTWRGFFVATAASYPANSVIHVRMWRPQRATPLASQSAIALIAVQTAASKLLDYVVVGGVISRAQDSWVVGHANGNTVYAKTTVLKVMPSAAAREDVTVQTDGRSHYTVYFGNTLVYQSDSLRLGVQPPLRVYLEVEARGVSYQVRFQDFWVAASDWVTINGLDAGDRVTLTPDGEAPIRAVADAAGQAHLQLPPTEAVGRAAVTFRGPHLRRRFAHVGYAGGDVFALRR